MRLVPALAVLAAGCASAPTVRPPVATAIAAPVPTAPSPDAVGERVDAAPPTADSLAAFVGAWTLTAFDTPVGTFTAPLTLRGDGTGTLHIAALSVVGALFEGARVEDGALVVPASFYATPPGDRFMTFIRLRPQPDGTLAGSWAVFGSVGEDLGTYRTTGVRTAE